MNTETNKQTQQEPKCPVTGEQKQDAVDPSIDSCLPKIFRIIMETLAEHAPEDEKETLLSMDEQSELYFLVRNAFLAGVNWTMHVPIRYAVKEFARYSRPEEPNTAALDDLVKQMKRALDTRPDEVRHDQ